MLVHPSVSAESLVKTSGTDKKIRLKTIIDFYANIVDFRKNPELKRDPLIKQLLNKDFANLHLSKKDIMSLVLLTHSNITQLEFNKMVNMWIKKAQHPHTEKRFL